MHLNALAKLELVLGLIHFLNNHYQQTNRIVSSYMWEHKNADWNFESVALVRGADQNVALETQLMVLLFIQKDFSYAYSILKIPHFGTRSRWLTWVSPNHWSTKFH